MGRSDECAMGFGHTPLVRQRKELSVSPGHHTCRSGFDARDFAAGQVALRAFLRGPFSCYFYFAGSRKNPDAFRTGISWLPLLSRTVGRFALVLWFFRFLWIVRPDRL